MTKQQTVLGYITLLGMYSASIIEERTDDISSQWWYKNAYKVYKKCKNFKKVAINKEDAEVLRNKLKQIQEIEEKHFSKGEWNPYALIIMCLRHLVEELNYVEFKNLFLDIDTKKENIYLDEAKEYEDLQRLSYRYFTDIIEIMGR